MSSQALGIEHVFVLMMENRAFDHMLGFAGIGGADAVTGQGTQINGLSGTESNQFGGATYTVSPGADRVMPIDPGHEFQMCSSGCAGRYTIPERRRLSGDHRQGGFVASYVTSDGKAPPRS